MIDSIQCIQRQLTVMINNIQCIQRQQTVMINNIQCIQRQQTVMIDNIQCIQRQTVMINNILLNREMTMTEVDGSLKFWLGWGMHKNLAGLSCLM